MIDGMMKLVAGLPLPRIRTRMGWSGGDVGAGPRAWDERRSRSRRLGELALGFYVLELSGGGKRPRDFAATGPFPF